MKKKRFFLSLWESVFCSGLLLFLYQQMLLKAHQGRLFPENMPLL